MKFIKQWGEFDNKPYIKMWFRRPSVIYNLRATWNFFRRYAGERDASAIRRKYERS